MPTEMTVPSVLESALTPTDIRAQVALIQQVMKDVMRDGEHYGVIPGTQKPTLLKPGAEKLCLTFRLDPEYQSTEMADGQHLTIKSKCTLYHINSQVRLGSGEGSCSTKESKYAYRTAARKCPQCGKEAIIKGKAEYGGGWLCFKKKDGCGAKYDEKDPSIVNQPQGQVPNENLADQYNTVLKMSNKRSLIAAVLNVTAASDIFTQDLEDFADLPPRKSPHSPPAAKLPLDEEDEGNGAEPASDVEIDPALVQLQTHAENIEQAKTQKEVMRTMTEARADPVLKDKPEIITQLSKFSSERLAALRG